MADGVVTTEEVVCLSKWLEDAGVMMEWPGTEIAETMERIMADGVVTDDERRELLSLLQRVDGSHKAGEATTVSSSGAGTKPAQTTTKVELTCVGNAGGGYINAQIRVLWFEVLVDEARKAVDVIEHYLPIKSHRREKRDRRPRVARGPERRVAPGEHEIEVFEEIAAPDGATPEEAAREMTARATATIEGWIRGAPEQWVWMHRRWKRRPPAE